MFGTPKPASGGLFGNSTSNTATPTGSSLFGAAKPAGSTLFGSTPTSTNVQSSGFGTGGSLFGSNTAMSNQNLTGGNLFGSNTSNSNQNTTGGGLFGSTSTVPTSSAAPAFGSANTGGGLFGNTSAAGSKPLFGSTNANTGSTTRNLFASTTSTPSTGLFGSTAGTATGGGLFGSTGATGGGLFGSTTAPQNQITPEEKSLQEIIANTTAIHAAISDPKLYGDDSDASITRLNQLLAATGIGIGFYDKDKPAIAFDPYNPYFQFRSIGYCALSRHRDSDGIVALILSRSAESLSTPQEKQKLIDDLFRFFDSNAKIHAHIVSIRPLTDTICEVEIYVTEAEVGRISAKKVYQAFEQNVKTSNEKRQIREQIKCEKVVPRVEMTQDDIKRYLSFPPKGFAENEWRSAIAHNPDPKNLLPYPIYGYKELADRRQRQVTEGEVHRKSFGQLNDRLKTATKDIQEINNFKKIFQEDAKRLRHRILRIIAVNHNNSHQSVVSVEEEKLLSRLETIAVCINAPNRLRQRCEELRSFMNSNKDGLEARKNEAADHQYLSAEESANLKRYLSRRQQDLELITESLKKDAEDIQVMVDQTV